MRPTAEDVFEPARNPEPELPWPAEWTAAAVIARLEPLVVDARRERLKAVFSARLDSVIAVMDSPHDPHNGAAVLRSCDAFGVQELHVVKRADPFLISGAVAKGTEHWVDVIVHDGPAAAVEALRARGYELVAAHPEGELMPSDLAGIPRLALLLGNEHDGLRVELASAARRSVRIPMRGFVESLNVSVSAAILLQAATSSRPGDLPPGREQLLYARGLYRSVTRARDVLAASRPSDHPAR